LKEERFQKIMDTLKYELVDGHIIIAFEGHRLLIDTGAPMSVANFSPLVIDGISHSVAKSYMGVTPESLSKSVGTQIAALVGADILNQYDIVIEPEKNEFFITREELPLAGTNLELDSFMGIPILEAKFNQETVRMFFDTGAKLSYLGSDLTADYNPAGEEKDFYPGMGEFVTRVFEIEFLLASERLCLKFGNLPEALQTMLLMADTAGILGTALFETHKIQLAMRRNKMSLQRIVK